MYQIYLTKSLFLDIRFFHFEHACPSSRHGFNFGSFLAFDASAFDSDVTYNNISILRGR